MMYRNNFVVVIKNKGKVLRESNSGVVRLPFGSDYSILLKNKDSRKAVADVEIDGEDVATGIIVDGNSSVELKGALNGLKVRNKFRFIKKTREISRFRGDRPDDGLVRVEYRFEQRDYVYTPIKPLKKKTRREWTEVDWTFTTNDTSEVRYGSSLNSPVSCNYCDSGITVPGAETDQNFEYGHTRTLEAQSHVIVIHLKGTVLRKTATGKRKKVRKVKKAVTVSSRVQCQTCGRKYKSYAKFCSNCGTYLK